MKNQDKYPTLFFSNQKLNEYLKKLRWWEKDRPNYSDKDLRDILVKNLKRYARGEVTQDFIIGLGSVIDPEVGMSATRDYDPDLKSATCKLDDLAIEKVEGKTVEGKAVLHTKKQIDQILRLILQRLDPDFVATPKMVR